MADAFRGIGASFNETPLTPRRVSEAVDRARRNDPEGRRRARMKPAPFDYIRPKSVAEASVALGRRGATTAAIAGGQSLLPMLSLRVALTDLLVDISRLDDLKVVTETPDSLWLGALTTHATIEDGKVPDIFDGLMRRVAGQISYRAVRNHGTIGGSVALADPAADWPACLIALDASVRVVGRNGVRVQSGRRFRPGRLRDHARPPATSSWASTCRRPSRRCAGASPRSRARAARSPIRSPSSHAAGKDGPVSVVLGARRARGRAR